MKKHSISAKASKEQDDWLTSLAAEGYRAVICRGHQAAIHVLQIYLGFTPVSAIDPLGWWTNTLTTFV
jgi:hypothetical protein